MKEIIGIILITICMVAVCYCAYQQLRLNELNKILYKWLWINDYTDVNPLIIDYIMQPSKINWFGLKYPRIEDLEKYYKL